MGSDGWYWMSTPAPNPFPQQSAIFPYVSECKSRPATDLDPAAGLRNTHFRNVTVHLSEMGCFRKNGGEMGKSVGKCFPPFFLVLGTLRVRCWVYYHPPRPGISEAWMGRRAAGPTTWRSQCTMTAVWPRLCRAGQGRAEQAPASLTCMQESGMFGSRAISWALMDGIGCPHLPQTRFPSNLPYFRMFWNLFFCKSELATDLDPLGAAS